MGPRSRTIFVMVMLAASLIAMRPAMAQRGAGGTPNIGSLFPRRMPKDTPFLVAQSLRRYNDAERGLFAEKTLDGAALVAHWRKLSTIRMRIERLESVGKLDAKDKELRQEIVRLLSDAVEVSVVGTGKVQEALRIAEDRRVGNLMGIAQLANRRLGTHILEVLGTAVTTGES